MQAHIHTYKDTDTQPHKHKFLQSTDLECPSRGRVFLKSAYLQLSNIILDQFFNESIRLSAFLWPNSNFLIGVQWSRILP